LSEAAVCLSLWAEYLGALGTTIAVDDPMWLGAPVERAGLVASGRRSARGWRPDVIRRAVIDG